MQAKDIEKYLARLGQELANLGMQEPVRVLMIGGAYMLLLAKAPRSTDDVDILWLEEEDALQRAIYTLRDGVQIVADKNALEPDWFNYMTHLLMFDLVIIPRGKLWRRYGPLHIYIPPKEYILALKILAGREKDIGDCEILLQQIKITTREQAQKLLDRYILPITQQQNANEIDKSLNELFGKG